jgi:Holliday junction resolvase RusA-like endonuclease
MSSTLRFVVPGIPVPKARPRLGAGGNVYTPKRTQGFEHTVATFAVQAMARNGWSRNPDDRYAVTLHVYWPDGRRRDLDNALKSTTDAMNGLAYTDDSQIVEVHAYGSVDSSRPRVEVQVVALGEAVASGDEEHVA